MRKFFYGLGILTAILLVAGGIGLFALARNGAALDTASKTYLEDAVVAVAGNWDADELWKRATPNFRKTTKQDDLRGLFDAARGALGPLVEYRGSRGEATMTVYNSTTSVFAKYVAAGHFQKGDAELRIVLVKQGDAWMIEGFHIASSALMSRLVGIRS